MRGPIRRGDATHLNSASNACLPVQDACWPGILGRNDLCFDGNFRPDRDATLDHRPARWEQAPPSSSEAAVGRRSLPNQSPGSKSGPALQSFGSLHDNLAGRGSASPSPQRIRRANLNKKLPGKIESETTQAGQQFDSCDAAADISRVRISWSTVIASVPRGAIKGDRNRVAERCGGRRPTPGCLAPFCYGPTNEADRLRQTSIDREAAE